MPEACTTRYVVLLRLGLICPLVSPTRQKLNRHQVEIRSIFLDLK